MKKKKTAKNIMDVILFGFGKMGQNIYRSLQKNPKVRNIYMVDPNCVPEEPLPLLFKKFQDLPHSAHINAAFIATNSVTHFDILNFVLNSGIKNVFCEKPMCLTQEEYDGIIPKLPPDSRFVVDYILRVSQALHTFQKEFANLCARGYHLTACNVDYGKDKTKDPRRFKDIGVYEELYHVWDLCFNGPLFGPIEHISVLKNIYIPDPEIKGRCIQRRFKYRIQRANEKPFLLNLNSSFQKDHLERKFTCFFKKDKQKQTLTLSFDKDKEDLCIRTTASGRTYTKNFPAPIKLDTMINDSVLYFMAGKKAPYFHGPIDSQRFHSLMTTLKQIAPLNRESIQYRIQQSTPSTTKN